MENNQDISPQEQVSPRGVTWGDLDTLFEHMGDGTSTNEAGNNIHLTDDSDHVALREDHEVHIPSEYLQDSYVGLRVSSLRRAREQLIQAKQERSSCKADVILGLATTFLGWFLGGLSSSVALNTLLGILMLCVAPCAAVGLFVAFFFMRKEESQSKSDLAERVLEYLADPDEKEPESDEH